MMPLATTDGGSVLRHLAMVMALCSACGGSTKPVCSPGRVDLDGVCVSERVADYVGCVRAQGAQLASDKREKLSADVGYAGAHAAAASDVSETLAKKYAASDAAVLEIVHACNRMSGMPGTEPLTPAATSAASAPVGAGSAAAADGRCECLPWVSVEFSLKEAGHVTCATGAECAARYNECADPLGAGKHWCFTTHKCPVATRSQDGLRSTRNCE